MDSGLLLQYLVIGAAVLASSGFVVKRQFPAATRRLCLALAIPMVREGRPDWVRALGRRIAPPTRGASACGGCDGCGPE